MPVETPQSVSLEDLTNRFIGLGVEEPSQKFLDAPDLVRPEKEQGDDNNYEAELQKSFADACMACTALVNDLNNIRSSIAGIWNALSGHNDGGVDLAVAAVATNTGIDLARNLIEQVLPVLEAHGNPCHVLEQWARWYAEADGFTKDEIDSWGKPGAGNEKMYAVADQCYPNANVLLRNFIKRIGGQDPSQVPLGVFEAYNPKSDRSKKDGHAKFEEDEQILGAFFTEALTLIHGVKAYPVEDMFLRGLCEFGETGRRPLYLVFAAQIIIDIHNFLRDDTSLGFRHLATHIDVMRADLQSQMEFTARVKSPSWLAENERDLREIERQMGWIKDDPVFLAKQRRAKTSGVLVTESQRYRLLKLSPIISGLLLFHFRAEMYEFSIMVLNRWGSVTYAAHLYNALVSEEELEDYSWPDMEITQNFLGESTLFIGDPPTDKEGYHKRLLLQMGFSASAISSNGLLKSNTKSRSGVRLIKRRAPVSSMFIDRYTRLCSRANFSPEDVDEILSRNQNEHREYERESSKINAAPRMAYANKNKDNPTPLQVYTCSASGKERVNQRKKATEGRKVTPKELILPLCEAMSGELTEFAMPYLRMHRLTWEILSGVKEACDPILLPLNGITYLQQEYQIPWVVIHIFAEFCHDPEGVGKELMRSAAQAFNKIVKEQGGADVVKKKFSELEGMTLYSKDELFGESHERYHERNDGEPAEDCDWDCGWHADWENDEDKEKEDDKES